MWLVGRSRSVIKHKLIAKQAKFLGSRIIAMPHTPLPSVSMAPLTPIIFISSIDAVKDDAWERMMKPLFEVSLFPTQLEVSTLVQTALDNAIGTAENSNSLQFSFS
jgi:hypothetical protein